MKRKRLLMLIGSLCLALMLLVPLAASCGPATPEEAAEEIAELEAGLKAEKAKVKGLESEVSDLEAEIAELRGPAEAEYLKLKWQCMWGAGDWESDMGVPGACEFIEEQTNGRIKVAPFYGGEVVPAEDMLIAVGEGILDIGNGASRKFVAQNLAFVAAGCVPGFDVGTIGDIQSFRMQSGAGEIVRQIFAESNAYVVNWYGYGECGYLSMIPIRSLDDWKGVKIRGSGAEAILRKALGMTPVMIPPGEMSSALLTGVIDVACYAPDAVKLMGLEDIIKYYILPPEGGHDGGYMFMNMDLWNSLSNEDQEVFHAASRWYFNALNEMYLYYIGYNVEPERKYEIIDLGPEASDYYLKMAIEFVWPEIASQSPLSAEYVEIGKEWFALPRY